jgi:cardiolipin synthase
MVWELTTFFVIAIYALTIISTILMMMMENRSPVKSIAWIIVLLVIPGFGLLIYVFFGRKFRKKMVISHRSLEKWHQRVAAIESDPVFGKSFPLEYRNMALLALHSSNAHLYINTDVRIFTDGPSLFDSIFEEMEKAEKFIHVEYYVFLSDEIGTRFINILKRKAAQGLEVRVIIDDVGSWMLKKSEVKKMREAGIQVYCFLKVGLPFLSSKINYRNHRKILVIDGKVGFTGGMNVADRYVKGSKWGTWRDTHLRLEGEGVHGLQRTFLADWFFVSRTLLRNDALYYPDVQSFGSSVIQTPRSSGDGNAKISPPPSSNVCPCASATTTIISMTAIRASRWMATRPSSSGCSKARKSV